MLSVGNGVLKGYDPDCTRSATELSKYASLEGRTSRTSGWDTDKQVPEDHPTAIRDKKLCTVLPAILRRESEQRSNIDSHHEEYVRKYSTKLGDADSFSWVIAIQAPTTFEPDDQFALTNPKGSIPDLMMGTIWSKSGKYKRKPAPAISNLREGVLEPHLKQHTCYRKLFSPLKKSFIQSSICVFRF